MQFTSIMKSECDANRKKYGNTNFIQHFNSYYINPNIDIDNKQKALGIWRKMSR